jgi:hypothetical protein
MTRHAHTATLLILAALSVLGSSRAQAATGVVKLTSAPSDARVTIGGKPFGRTPALLELPEGPYALTISKDGYEPMQERVTVVADRIVKVHLGLTRAAAGSGIRVRDEQGPAFGPGRGTVTVVTQPAGLLVTMNGQSVPAPTPVTFDIEAGSYELSLESNGEISYRRNVVVRPGSDIELDLRVTRKRTIDDSDPWSNEEPVPAAGGSTP